MHLLIGLPATLLSVLALLLAPLLVVDERMVRRALADGATRVLGREVRIGGLDVAADGVVRVTLRDLRVANPDWAETPALARIARVEIALRPGTLLGERALIVPRFVVEEPRLWLERDAEGRRNWRFERFDGGGGADGDGDEAARPPRWAVGDLTVRGGSVTVRDAPTRTDATLRRIRLDGEVPRAGRVALDLEAQLDGAPVAGALRAPRQAATEGARPLRSSLQLGSASFEVSSDGEPPAGWNLRFEAPTLAAFPDALGLPFPDTPPVRFGGRLSRTEAGVRAEALDGAIGESVFSGRLGWRTTVPRPTIVGRLDFARFRAADFAGIVGAGPRDPSVLRGESPLPEERFDARELFTFDADLDLSARRVEVPFAPVTGLDGRLRIAAGRLEVDPLRLEVAGGTARGEVALNGREIPPSADVDLAFERIELARFFEGTRFLEEMGGRFSGDVYLLGVGASVDTLFARARGRAQLRMDGGSLSGLAVEAVGLDVLEALALVVGADTRVPIACAGVDVDVEGGRARLTRAVVDTRDSVITAAGTVDLADEALDLELRADAKDFSLVDATAPVHVRGAVLDPEIELGAIEGLPLFELGDAPSVSCPIPLPE